MKIKLTKEEQEKLQSVGLVNVGRQVEVEDPVFRKNYAEWKKTLPLAGHSTLTLKAISTCLWTKRSGEHRKDFELPSAQPKQEVKVQGKFPRWELRIIIGLLVLILGWLIFALPARAQFSQIVFIEWQDGGTPITDGFFTYPFSIDCGANLTCTSDGTTLSIVAGAGGSVAWDGITNPVGNQSLTMAAFTTLWTYSATTGAGNLFSGTDTLNNTGTGYLFNWTTASGSTLKPFRICYRGTSDCITFDTTTLQATGSAIIQANTGDSATAFFSSGLLENSIGGTGIDSSGSTGFARVAAGSWSFVSASGVGTCTNQFARVLNDNAAPTCATVASTDTSGTFPADAHNLLSVSHGDTLAASVVQGDFAIGNVTPAWSRLALGGVNLYPKSNGTTVVYSTLAAAGVGACTNQFVRALNADAAPTCNTVLPADMDLTANYTWTGQHDFDSAEILSAIPLRFEGLTDDNVYTTITITDPTVGRTVTFPNADSNTVQPLTCGGTDKFSAVSALGVFVCDTDQTAGGAFWEAITNSSDTATLYTGDNNAETFTINFTSNWATDRLIFSQGAGNPTGGSLVTISYTDTDIDAFTISDGTDTLVANSNAFGVLVLSTTGAAEIHATEVIINVQKGSPGTITAGEVVYQSGYDTVDNVVEVELADSDSASTMPAIGIAEDSITDTASGHVVAFGTLPGVDTSSFSTSDDLYVSGTAGALTNTKPTGTALIQRIAQVGRSHVSLGIVEISGAGRSNDLPNIANDNIWIGDGSGVPAASVITDCVDTGGNHLNYTQSTNAFACGTSLPSTVVETNQSNTFSTGDQSFAAATSLTMPTAAGAAPTSSGDIRYDSTSFTLEYGDNGTNRLVANLDEAQTLTNKTLDAGVATTTHAAGANFLRTLRHATDCTAITDGLYGELCWEIDVNRLFMCENAAGCAVPGDWIQDTDSGGNVDLLDGSVHQDTTACTVARGDLIVGLTATPTWDCLTVGGANTIFGSDGTDPTWETSTGTTSPVRANNPLFPVQVRFTAIGAPSYVAGNLFYDSGNESITFHNNEADVALQIGQESWLRVRNVTGSTINNGQVVYIVGIDSGLPSIALARADVMATAQAVGIATHSIEDTTNGYVTAFGLVRDFDTSAFTVADRLYLSATTAGLMTNTAPSDPNFVVPIAIVTEDNVSTGDVLVTLAPPRPTGGAGILVSGNSISTLSSEEDFLVTGALSCGASTRGKMQTHTTPLQYCDDGAPPVLQYAAYADSVGAAADVQADVVTFAKMQNITSDRLLGRDTAGSGDPEELTVGAGIEFTGSGGIGLATANRIFDKSIVVIDPTTSEDDKVQWMHGKAVTYTDVDCSTDAGTVTIDMDHRVITTPNTAGTDILTGTIICDTDNQADGGFADATIPANVPVNLSITAVSGAGTVRIHVRGTVDP